MLRNEILVPLNHIARLVVIYLGLIQMQQFLIIALTLIFVEELKTPINESENHVDFLTYELPLPLSLIRISDLRKPHYRLSCLIRDLLINLHSRQEIHRNKNLV